MVGCLVAAGFVGILVLIGVFIFVKGKRELEPVAEQYLAAVEKGEYDAAWAGVGEVWKATQSRDEFVAFEEATRGRLGALKEKSMTGVHMNSNSSGTTARVVYSAEFEKGAATVTFMMSKHGEEWLIDRVRYDSPVLPSPASCPKCGRGAAPGERFCSDCGSGLGGAVGPGPPADAPADFVEGPDGAETPAPEEGF
ncbi:MAG: DUF4019 domain-containing protein [Planctomycetota bacterium]|jgi:hypothetical protein